MDTRPKIEPDRPTRVLSANFSDSGLHFAVGLEDGFRGGSPDENQFQILMIADNRQLSMLTLVSCLSPKVCGL